MAHEWGNESEDTSNDAFSEIDFQDGHYRNNNRRGNNNSNKFDGPRNDRMTEDIEVVHTRSKDKRKKVKGGGLSDVVMYPTSTLNSRPPRNNRASPPSNADKNTMRNGNGNGNGTEAYYTPTTSPSSPDKIGNKTGSSSWFPMSMPSIGSLLSQPSDENPSTQSGSYQSGRSRESSNQIQPPFAMHSGSMSPTIQNIPSNITNPFSSWSSSDSPTKRSSPRATTRGGQTNPFASKSSSTSPSGQTKKHSNKKIGSRSTSASPPNSNGNGNGDDKRSPLALASRSLSKSPQGSYNQFNPRSRSPTIGDNHRSYSRSPSPVYQRPSRTINTNQSEFHTLLSCAASPDDAQFLDALELLATSRNPRKLAQMKLSDAHDWTALHIAVLSNPPLYLIYALLLVFPEGAKELDNAGRLPLHLSAGNETSVSVLNTLVRFHNNAICEKDDRGYIPLHLALLRDGNEEIPVDVLRIFLGQTVGNGEAVIRLGGGATPRGVRDGYMRNKEHLNLELDEIQGGLLGVSRNATVMRERKRREEMMRLTKNNTREPLSRGFARNIQDVDSQDGDPLKHEHLSSLWMNDAQYQSDPFSDMELEAVNQFSTEVTHCLKQLAQWKKRYDRDQKSETPSKDTESPQIMNPATIPAPPYMRLPLHMAVRRNHKKKSQDGATHRFQTLAPPPNQNEILRILIHAFPPSLMIKDAHDKTPLMTCLALVHHPAIHPVDLNMIELLLGKRSIGYREAPKWLEDIDFSRQHQKSISHHAHEIQQSSRTLATNAAMIPCDETLPLHIAARESLPTSIVHTIYASYPGAKYAQDERDCTPLHSALQNLTGRTTINLEMINMLMDDKVLRIKNSVDQSIFDLLVANAKAGKLPTKFKRIKHAETGKSVKATTIFQPVFHQVIMDEVLASSGERKEEEFLSDLYSLPSTMRRQACGTPSFQYLLLKELASGANAASIFLYGIALLTLAISFSSMVDTFISHRTDDDITTSNTQKTVIFVTNAYLSVHGLLYAAMTINLNISITESLANIWTWVTFIALLLSFIVTVYIGNQERSLGSIDLSDSHLVTMSTIAIGTLWSAFVGYLARWWYGISIFCSSVVKVRFPQHSLPFLLLFYIDAHSQS